MTDIPERLDQPLTPDDKHANSPYRTSDRSVRPVNNTKRDLVSERSPCICPRCGEAWVRHPRTTDGQPSEQPTDCPTPAHAGHPHLSGGEEGIRGRSTTSNGPAWAGFDYGLALTHMALGR